MVDGQGVRDDIPTLPTNELITNERCDNKHTCAINTLAIKAMIRTTVNIHLPIGKGVDLSNIN